MKYVALLRGVNVGGGNKVPMAALRALCEEMGWSDVQTYVASGNVVFCCEGEPGQLATDLRKTMAEGMGLDVPVLVLPGVELIGALRECPIVPEKGNQLHAAFLWGAPRFDGALYERLKTEGESVQISGRVVWVHTPHGYGQSKLADGLQRVLGTDFTARNLNTLQKLAEML